MKNTKSDPAVAGAVEQIVKQLKSKRMILFGLKNLARFCSTSTNKYKVNSLDALMKNVVPALKACAETYANSEEVIQPAIVILFGISDALIDGQLRSETQKFKQDGALEAGLLILKATHMANYTDSSIFFLVVDYLNNLEKLDIKFDEITYVTHIQKNLKRNMNLEVFRNVLKSLMPYTNKSNCVEIFNKENTTEILLSIIEESKIASDVTAAEMSLKFLINLTQNEKLSLQAIDRIVTLIDHHKSNSTIQELGGTLLSSKFGHDELHMCISNLNAPKDSPQRKDAYVMLALLSYVSKYAEAIAQSKGIPIVCNAITTSATDLLESPNEPQLKKCLMGAVKMMGRIASIPMYTEEAVESGGLTALSFALTSSDNAEFISIILQAMVRLTKVPSCEPIVLSEDLLSTLFDNINKYKKEPTVVSSALNILNNILAFDKTCTAFMGMNNSANTILDLLTQYSKEPSIQEPCLQCLEMIMRRNAKLPSESLDKLNNLVYSALDQSLNDPKNEKVAMSCLRILQYIIRANGKIHNKEAIFGCILKCLITFPNNPEVHIGKSLVDYLADESTVRKSLKDLSDATCASYNKTSSEKLYATLTAINGLCQLEGLTTVYREEDTAEKVIQTISSCVNLASFNKQQEILATSLEILPRVVKFDDSLIKHFQILLDICLAPNSIKLLEKQSGSCNSIIDILVSLQNISINLKSVSDGVLDSIIANVNKISLKFQDYKFIIKEVFVLFSCIVRQFHKQCKDLIINNGVIKNVLFLMKRLILVEEVQISGMELLLHILSIDSDENLQNMMKLGGAIDVSKLSIAAHDKSTKVRSLFQKLLGLLQPGNEVEADIKNIIHEIDLLTKPECLERKLEELNKLLGTSQAIRFAAMYRIGATIDRAFDLANNDSVEEDSLVCALAECSESLSRTRGGINHLEYFNIFSRITDCTDNILTKDIPPNAPDYQERSSYRRRTIIANASILQKIIAKSNQSLNPEQIERNFIAYKQIALKHMGTDPDLSQQCNNFLVKLGKTYPIIVKKHFHEYVDSILERYEDENIDAGEKVTLLNTLACIYKESNKEIVDHINSKIKVEKLLFDMNDKVNGTPELTSKIINCLNAINKTSNIDMEKAFEKDKAYLASLLRVTNRPQEYDNTTKLNSLKLISRICTHSDKAMLISEDIAQTIFGITREHCEDSELMSSVGKILQIIGAEEVLERTISEAISVMNCKPDNWEVSLEILISQINLFMAANIENPQETFTKMPELIKHFDQLFKDGSLQNDDTKVAYSTMVRLFVEKFKHHETFGVTNFKNYIPIMLNELTVSKSSLSKNSVYISNSYQLLSIAVEKDNANTSKLITDSKLLDSTLNCLALSQSSESSLTLLKFLNTLVKENDHIAVALSNTKLPFDKRSPTDGVNDLLINIIKKERQNPEIVINGLELLCTLMEKNKTACSQENLETLSKIISETGLVNTFNFLTKLIEIGQINNFSISHAELDENFASMMNDPDITMEEREKLQLAYLKYTEALSKAEDAELYLENRPLILDNILCILTDSDATPEMLKAALNSSICLANSSPEGCARLARCIPQVLLQKYSSKIIEDADMSYKLVELFYLIQCDEANGNILTKIDKFKPTMDAIKMNSAEIDQKYDNNFTSIMQGLIRVIKDNTAKDLTLELIWELWITKTFNGESLIISDSAVLLQQFNCVCDSMNVLATIKYEGNENDLVHINATEPKNEEAEELDPESIEFKKREFIYGCKCIQLMHENSENVIHSTDSSLPVMLNKALMVQKNDIIMKPLIAAAIALTQHIECAQMFSRAPNAPQIVINVLKIGKNGATKPSRSKLAPNVIAENDENILCRLLLLQQCAVSNKLFNNTDCMAELLQLWKDCENGVYSDSVLSSVFKTTRFLYNKSWSDLMIEKNVFNELYNLIVTCKNYEALRDALFLASSLSDLYNTDRLVLSMIEAIIELVNKCLYQEFLGDDDVPVITNSCLTLAKLSTFNEECYNKFLSKKGFDMVIDVMKYALYHDREFLRKSQAVPLISATSQNSNKPLEICESDGAADLDYDIANAASILICNLCFRRDAAKKLLGELGGPNIICNCLYRYKGSESTKTIRSLRSMIMSVGNLSLYVPNASKFAHEHIEMVFIHLLEYTEYLSEELVETMVLTMNNLVLDYDEHISAQYGVLMDPLLTMIQTTKKHKSVTFLCLSIDVFTNLCRLNKNAIDFVNTPNSLTLLIKLYKTYNQPRLNYSIVQLFSVLSQNKPVIDKLISSGLFELLIAIFTDESTLEESSELVVPGLRGIRRLLSTSSGLIDVAIQSNIKTGVMNAIQFSRVLSLNQHEAILTLAVLLYLASNSQEAANYLTADKNQTVEDDWDLPDIEDEGVLGWQHLIKRPIEPRNWEILGLTLNNINSLIVQFLYIMKTDSEFRQKKLQYLLLHVLAYFACEKNMENIDSFYVGEFSTLLTGILNVYINDVEIINKCVIILINVLYMSEMDAAASVFKDHSLHEALQKACRNVPAKTYPAENKLLTSLIKVLDSKTTDLRALEPYTQWDYVIFEPKIMVPKYPNGLSDLPNHLKTQLRHGSKQKQILETGEVVSFTWKSSQDLMRFLWKNTEAENSPFKNQISITKINGITAGFGSHPQLSVLEKKHDSKSVVTLFYVSLEDLSHKSYIVIKLDNRKKVQQYLDLFIEWKDAATY